MSKLIKIGLVAVLAGGIFAAGSMTGNANTGWLDLLIRENDEALRDVGSQTTEELVGDIDSTLRDLIQAKANDELTQEKQKLIVELEEYFNQKLENITTTEVYQTVIDNINSRSKSVSDALKAQIDEAFNQAVEEVEPIQ